MDKKNQIKALITALLMIIVTVIIGIFGMRNLFIGNDVAGFLQCMCSLALAVVVIVYALSNIRLINESEKRSK